MQKKRFQNALAMLLAVVMILGMLPAAVGAVDLAEEPTNEQQASTTAEPENPVQKHRRKPPLKQQPRRKARRRLLQSNP